MEEDVREYLQMRAEIEQSLSEQATHPNAAHAHRHLSSLYRSRLDELERSEQRLRPARRAN